MKDTFHAALFAALVTLGLTGMAFLLPAGAQTSVPAAQTAPQAYKLLTNATATGPAMARVRGGAYLFDVRGTIAGATIALTVSNADGTFSTLVSATQAGTYGPFSIGAGSTVQATVTGGAPTGLYANLEGIGG
jgi:hypothetical protein